MVQEQKRTLKKMASSGKIQIKGYIVPADKKNDRTLGEEWADWNGNVQEKRPAAGRKPFLLISVAATVLVVLVLFVFWYLIHPRMLSFGKTAALLTGVFITGISLFLFAMIVSISFLALNKHAGCPYKGTFLARLLFLLYRASTILGRNIGLSRDYIGNSFLKVSNEIVKKGFRNIDSPEKILLLLPRCLEKTLLKELSELSRTIGCRCFVLSGGTAARKKIQEQRPQAIIAVACERDLVSGLIDVSGRIPVIAIPNTRPEGPCKNTRINLEEVRAAVLFFLSEGNRK